MEENFYLVVHDFYDFVTMAERNDIVREAHICSNCGTIIRDYQRPFEVYLEGDYEDRAHWYRTGILNVISKELQEVFEKANVTGYQLGDIHFMGWFDYDDNPLDIGSEGLKEIIVTGRCGFLCHKDGSRIKKCKLCNTYDDDDIRSSSGLSFNLKDWDGTDIFVFDNWIGNIIVNSKVKDLIEKGDFKDIYFVDLSKFEFSYES